MDNLTDFYVTVSSSDSPLFFPSNEACDFKTQLSKPINLPAGAYEVGLHSLSIFLAPVPEVVKEPIIESLKSFFKGERAYANVYTRRQTHIHMNKSADLDELQILVEARFKEVKTKLLITKLIVSETETKSVITWEDPQHNRYLEIPEELARSYGFTIRVFAPGRYESEQMRDPVYYSSIDPGVSLVFRCFFFEISQVEFSEPKAYSLEELIHTLSDAFSAAKLAVGFIQSKTKGAVNVRIQDENLSFILSPNLCELFGIERNDTFRGSKTPVFILR